MSSVRSPFRVVLGFLFILKIHGLTGSLHKNISASVNSDAELIWTYQLETGVTPLFESWQKLPEIGIASRTTVAVYTAMLYEGRIELFGQAGLQLKNVTLSDTGVYQLYTVFSDGTSQTNNISVQVIDPCEENDCAPAVAVCVPEGFNFSCRCNSGYEGDGRICVDVNECATIPNLCAGGECRNTKGGYMCTCPNGFVINADGTKCIDNDECAMNGRLCENGQCLNIPGSYSCDCDMGLFAGFAFLVST